MAVLRPHIHLGMCGREAATCPKLGKFPGSGSRQDESELGACWTRIRQSTTEHGRYDRIYEMGNRIDELEQSINNLKAEMGTDGVSESKSEDPKPSVGSS
ncbi:hypothetical protein J5N97_008917 [Dioscorea zingiberensis]|uniref:Uncharacterized protein n=1 Tax=Dioscorea zingiberensis TaxID=325984 RepID=A0A9D5CX84_9LILI|nr:hypothetical protein J5N97_008917 [Dioscorea zingiberensis]